ncbi:hypothetical protein [Ramlibacter sp. PS4R-6]|uniref:hypothetical protein n=1 Tax=Ramlibacter sp. PS4R-6 TaxID=3133438 RepID=UPI0030B5AD64
MSFAAFDPANDEDGLPIVLREPRQSWRANVFWGLGLGLPALLLPPFAGAEADWLEKAGTMLVGAGWMAFMGANAWRNWGRTVRCDMETIAVAQAFASRTIPLAAVASIEREDVRQSLRDFDNIGVSWRERARQMDTTAPINMYVLRDAAGQTLLRIDEEMEPPQALARFVQRVQRQVRRAR